MSDFDTLDKIKPLEQEPTSQDLAILDKYFKNDGGSGSSGTKFPVMYFSIFMFLIIVLLNPITTNLVLKQLSPTLFFLVQTLILGGAVGYMLWKEQ